MGNRYSSVPTPARPRQSCYASTRAVVMRMSATAGSSRRRRSTRVPSQSHARFGVTFTPPPPAPWMHAPSTESLVAVRFFSVQVSECSLVRLAFVELFATRKEWNHVG